MDDHSKDIEIIKQIDSYLKDRLTEDQAEKLWIDLLKNPQYLEYLETEITARSILQQAGSNARTVEEPGGYWKWLAAAAAVVIFAVTFSYLVSSPDRPLQRHALAEISLADNLAAPTVLRSESPGLSHADSLLNLGLEAALSGNLPQALHTYQSVVREYEQQPVSASAWLNIGIIRYNAGEHSAAAEAFGQAATLVRGDTVLEEDAYWYQANSYINLDRLEQAKEALATVIRMEGVHGEKARRLLKNLKNED